LIKAYDPVFSLSDFEHKKNAKQQRQVKYANIIINSIDQEIKTKLNEQYIRFTIRPGMTTFTDNFCPY